MRNTTKVEALIESCRSEGKWQKVIELTDELKNGSPNSGKIMNFVMKAIYIMSLTLKFSNYIKKIV